MSRRALDQVWGCAILAFCFAALLPQAIFAQDSQQIVLHKPSFSVGGMRLSETVNLGSNFRCKTSDQFTDFDWCVAASQEREARGEFEQRTTVLRSIDGRAFYLNRSLEPAFFAPKEIEHDIDVLIAKFGEKPVVLSMPKRTGLGNGIIATWGGLTLHQLTKEQEAPLAGSQSPKVGLLVDFLNDFVTSAKSDLPVYRLEGSAGYIYNATFGADGRGKLRLLAADLSALSGTSKSSPREPKSSGSADGTSSGSGFFVSTKGHVLTNAHVVAGCSSITVSQPGQPPSEGRLIAKDRLNDLALIQTKDQPSSVPPLRGSVRLGEQVAAYGFPLSGILATTGNFTLGNVTATAGLQDDSRILQISSPVQPGNSGGPLLDEAGNVVGIVVAKLDALQFAAITKDVPQNINFAIKAAVVQTFLETNGITNTSSPSTLHLAPDDIAEMAKSFTVFVECNASQRP